MIKNAQNVIGSVMCCPGCFSLYRASAIRQVMDKYVTPTRTPFTVYIKDTGQLGFYDWNEWIVFNSWYNISIHSTYTCLCLSTLDNY